MIIEPSQKKSLSELTIDLELLERQMDESATISAEQVKEWSFAKDLLQTKTNGWIAYLDMAESQIAMANVQLKRVQAQKKSKEAVLKGLHQYLSHVLSNTEGRAIKGTEGTISLVKNPASLNITFPVVNYSSTAVIPTDCMIPFPERFVQTVVIRTIDKALLKDALKSGLSVPFSELTYSERIKVK